MAELWSVYSKPVPADSWELRALFLQCSCITVLLGGLFYNWLLASLEYPRHISVAMAVTFSLLLLLTLFLVHPVRCAFSIAMPTLGTKQGRKLLLSTCIMIAVVNITPNVISNIKTLLQVILCISKNSSESLLNSTALLENASRKLGDEIQNYAILKPMDGHFQFSLMKNSSLVNQQVHLAGEKARRDFLAVEVLVKDCVRAGNKLVAAFSVLYLCFESAWYLKNYLTNLRFDNIYITTKLQRLAEDRGASHLLAGSPQRLIHPTGLRLSREELTLCLAQVLRFSVALLLVLVLVALEHLIFGVADTAVRRMAQLSTVPVTLSIKYQAHASFNLLLSLFQAGIDILKIPVSVRDVNRSYHHSLTFSSARCRIRPPAPPNPSVLLVVGLLFCIIYATVFLETYARRLCRKIAASFFESQEEERAQYLYSKLSRQHRET
ncbi:OCSTP protein, partial [Odontophorus gujanensis]|nr:OCSTP protein [Odontophorus gujanensis]